jgi:hypothetical protein
LVKFDEKGCKVQVKLATDRHRQIFLLSTGGSNKRSVSVCVSPWLILFNDRSTDFKVIDDFDGSVGAARKLDSPVLLILAADDPCKGDNTQIDVDIDIERTDFGFGNQLGFDFIADQIVIPDIAIGPLTNLKIIRVPTTPVSVT